MIGIYARVSTQEQAQEGYSIEEQIDRLKKYCESLGRSDFKTYVDAGFSGAKMERPDLKRLISDVKSGQIDKVVVYKLDRLSRSQKDTLYLIEDVFLKSGAEFESMNERFDTGTSFGRAMIGILAVFAQLEREQIRERMSMGLHGRSKEGKWHGGGNDPIGYTYKDGMLQIDDYEAMQVRECFNLFISGYNYGEIARSLNDRGFIQKGYDWSGHRVKLVLRNNLYIGIIKHRGEEYQGIHEPIIDSETFEKAQKLIKTRYENYKELGIQTRGEKALLSGLLYCADCGARYCKSRSGKYYYYTCYSRRKMNVKMIKDPNCKNINYRDTRLESLIIDQIKKLEADPDFINEVQTYSQTEEKEKLIILENEIKKIDSQRQRFMSLYGLGEFSAEELQSYIMPLTAQKKSLQAEIDSLNVKEPELGAVEAMQAVENFSDIVERGNTEEIRLVIRTLIKKIVIDHENIMIYWRFS